MQEVESNHHLWLRRPERIHFSILPEPGLHRVCNRFIVLCFPLGCFMLCQPHRVVSDNYAYLYLIKTSFYSVCALLNRFKLRDHVPTGRMKITYRLCHTTPSGFVHNAQSASFFHLHYGTSGFLGRNGNSGTRTPDFSVMSRTF